MEQQTNAVESLFENAGSYLETTVDLIKLKAVDKSSDAFSLMALKLIILLIVLIVIVFSGVGIALFIGEITGKTYYGFFAVAGFYIVTGIILYIFRKQWIREPFSNLFVQELLK